MTIELIYTPLAKKLRNGNYSYDIYLDAFINEDWNIKIYFGYNTLNTTTDFENVGARWNGHDWVIDFEIGEA